MTLGDCAPLSGNSTAAARNRTKFARGGLVRTREKETRKAPESRVAANRRSRLAAEHVDAMTVPLLAPHREAR
jgi:hypothetical protein